MTVEEWSIMYNAIFIIILCAVCFIFSCIHLKIAKRFTKKRWLFTSVYFIVVVFSTITLWYATIGFIV